VMAISSPLFFELLLP